MLTIGLTGDVGAGKSTLSRVLKRMGATVLDADKIARDLWKLPEVQKLAEERWGEGFFKGRRKKIHSKIANIIFNDEKEYEFASRLLHERTFDELKSLIESSKGVVVVEMPLLFECGVADWFDDIIYVTSEMEKRKELIAKRKWDIKEVERREAKMLPREEKISQSDWVLENNGTLKEWKKRAKELGKTLMSKV